MRLTVIGSGTLLPDAQHTSAAHWLEFGDVRMLLDCGAGALHGMAREGLPWRTLTHLLVTHFHTDHVGDLAAIFWALRHGIHPPRRDRLVLLGPEGLASHLGALAGAHGHHVEDPGFPLEVVELSGGDVHVDRGGGFTLRAHGTPHTAVSIGVRIEAPAGAVGYTGDTGPSDPLASFFEGVSVLVAECGQSDPARFPNHLSPRSLAALACAAEPGLVVVTHVLPSLRRSEVPELIRDGGYEGEVLMATDGTTVVLEGGRPRSLPR